MGRENAMPNKFALHIVIYIVTINILKSCNIFVITLFHTKIDMLSVNLTPRKAIIRLP